MLALHTTLSDAFKVFNEDTIYSDFIPTFPNLFGYENSHIGKILVQLGIYSNTKQMKQELGPYIITDNATLSIFTTERLTKFNDVPNWLVTKSKAMKIISKFSPVLGVVLPSNTDLLDAIAKRATDTSLSRAVHLTNILIDLFEPSLKINFTQDTHINECMLIISALAGLGSKDARLSVLVATIFEHPDPVSILERIYTSTRLANIKKFIEEEASGSFGSGDIIRALNRLLPNIKEAKDLLLHPDASVQSMFDNPRQAYYELSVKSVQHSYKLLDKIHSKLNLEECKNLVDDSIIELQVKMKSAPLKALAKSIRSIFEFDIDVPVFETCPEDLAKLASEGRYAELAKLANELDAKRNDASKAYYDLAEFIQVQADSFPVCTDDENTSSTIALLKSKLSEATTELEVTAADNDRLKEKLVKVYQETNIDKVATKVSADIISLLAGKGNVVAVLNSIKQIYPEIVFLPSMWQHAEASMYNKHDKLFSALHSLCDDYYNAIISGRPDCEAMKYLNNYRANESESTMANKEYAKYRTHSVAGTDVIFEQHITLGVRRNATTTIQIFFRIIDNVMHIAYVGPHLPVSSS